MGDSCQREQQREPCLVTIQEFLYRSRTVRVHRLCDRSDLVVVDATGRLVCRIRNIGNRVSNYDALMSCMTRFTTNGLISGQTLSVSIGI